MKHKNKLSRYGIIAPSLILLLCVSGYILVHRGTSDSSNEKNISTAIQQKNQTQKSAAQNAKTPTVPISTSTTNQVPSNPAATATITRLDEANNTIYFAVNLENVSSDGTCVVTFSNPNDKPVTKQFNPAAKDGAVACGTYTISAYEFSYLGDWQVQFTYYSANSKTTAEGTINIR